jgi:hypothetical protein
VVYHGLGTNSPLHGFVLELGNVCHRDELELGRAIALYPPSLGFRRQRGVGLRGGWGCLGVSVCSRFEGMVFSPLSWSVFSDAMTLGASMKRRAVMVSRRGARVSFKETSCRARTAHVGMHVVPVESQCWNVRVEVGMLARLVSAHGLAGGGRRSSCGPACSQSRLRRSYSRALGLYDDIQFFLV